jgi:hypothetical protein
MLSFDVTLFPCALFFPASQDAITRITNATRTCDLILGAGDGKASTFRAFQVVNGEASTW